MKYVLGIDQGGSKTHAAVANDRGEILGLGAGRGANHASHGMAAAMDAVLDAAVQACTAAGISLDQIDMVAGGITGVDWDYETQLIGSNVSETLRIPADRVHVVNDCLIALRAGLSKPAGCILCAGSGLNCGVRKDAEHEYVYGYYIDDDDQGGGALGRRTVQAVLDSEAMLLPPTKLTQAVLEYLGFDTVDAMLQKKVTDGLDSGKVLRLPEVLERVALAGDEVAKDVLRIFGRDIARYVTAGLRRFGMQDDEVDVVLSGSVFKCRAPELEDTVVTEILAEAPKAKIVECEYEPIVGAVLLALDQLNVSEDENVLKQIRQDVYRLRLMRRADA